MSAAKGSEAACRVLIEHRANVNAQDQDEWTALHVAADRGHTATVDALIQGRADVNAGDSVRAGMSGLFSAGRLICFFLYGIFFLCVCAYLPI